MPDKIKEVFDLISDKGYFTDEAEFRGYVSDPTKRKEAFELIKDDGYFTDENEFNSFFSAEPEKKKFKVEDFNKKYGTSYTEQEFGVKNPSQSKLHSTSTTTQTTTTPQPKKISVGEETIKLKENNLREQESLFKSFEPKIAELNAAMQPYNELAKQNGGTLPPEEFAQYQQLYNESRKLSSEYKLAYNGYQQAFNEYKGEIGKFNASIEAGKKETEAQKVKRLGEEKAKVEKLGKTNPLGRIKLYTQTIDNINQKIPFLVEEYNKAEQAGDEAAMQKIELEIDKQQANIDYMTKAIEGQKKLGAMQVEDNLVNSFNVGLYRVIGKSMQVKKDLDESLVRLINDVTGVDQKFTDTYFKHIYKDKSPLSDKFAEAGKYIQKKAEEKGELKNLNRKYGASAWNAMEKGDVPTAIEYAFKDFIGFLPASLMYQNAATAVTSSIGIVGDELEAAKERGKTPNSKTVLAGGIKAGLEIATERWLGAGKATKQLIDRLGGDGAEQVVREVYEGVAKKSLGRKVAENVSEEVIGENINLLGSNAVDIFINETKEPDQLFEGIGDNTLVSIFGGGVQSTVTTTASHYIDRAKLKEAEAAKAKAQSLQEQALEAESPVVAEAIEKEAEKLNDWADEVIDWNNEIGANSDPEIIAEIESNNDKIDELEATIAESTPEIAEILTVQLQEIESANVELVKTAEQIALERLESILNERKPIEQPSVEFEQPSVNLSVKENPFKESLRKLGYEDSDIDKMTMEQMQEIVTNKTEAPIVESTAKVDSVKENKKQERLAEMNKELDEKITQDEPTIIESRTPKGDKGVEVAKPTIQTSTEEVVSSSEPSKADKSYKEAQEVNTVVSKENPNASVLIQPKGEDLSLTAVYVGKENRGKGIGTKVLESVKKQADKLGKKVILDATNELDSETDLERLGKFYEKNGFVKVGDNKYEYDPKNEDSSGDISTRNDNSRTKEQGISGVNDKGKPDKKPTTSTEEVVKEQATEGPKSVVSKKETTAKEQEIEGVDNTKKYIENLANDNYLFTHVTTEDNARSITNGGMNVSLGTGISSTLTQLGSEGTNSQIERLANGEIVHRDKNNNSVAVIAVPKSELDAMQGSSLAEKFENWLVENNKINEKGQLAIPSEFNAGYFNGKNFVTKSNPKQNTNEKTNEKVEPTKDKAVTEVSSEDSGENQKTEPKAVSEKGAEVETKAEKKAKVEKSIDDIAERLKKKFAITTLPQGTKTSGFSQEDLIDLVAKVAKEIAKTGIDITEAVKQVIADLRENGDLEGFDEVDIEAKSNEKASAKEEVKEEGKQKKSGFQERSIEDAQDEVVKQIARENEVYYTTMNQKEEYDRAKKEFPDAQSVSDNMESLFPDEVKLTNAARLQVRRQVAMQTLSMEISKQLMEGKNPTELNNKVNRIQNALAKDFAKGGQIGAMAIWKFMTPMGIVYQVKEKIKQQNSIIESRLTEEQKKEVEELNDKIVKLQAKLDEEIAKTAERKSSAQKPKKGLSEEKKARKEELKNELKKKMFGQLNDITNIPRILFDKDTIEYAKLVVEEGASDFKSFAKEMTNDFGNAIKPILPRLYEKITGEGLLDAKSKQQMEEFLLKEFAKSYGTSKIPSKRKPKTDITKILEGVNSGVLNDNFYKALFLEKFGMKADLTLEDTAELMRLAEAVSSLPATSKLYNIAVMNMAQFINSKYPRNFFSDLADTWVALNYAQMLSGVSTHILNIFSTGSGILNSPFRNAFNLSKWYRAMKEGIKEGSFSTFLAYNPVYESTYILAAWASGVKVGSDIAMSTMMEGATTDKYVEGLINQKGKVTVSNLDQNRYGVGKRFKPIRLFGVDVNPYNKLKYVGRSLAAEDAFMFQTAYEAELAGLALSINREKGLRGKALRNAVIEAYTQNSVNMEEINKTLENEVDILEKSGAKVTERDKRIRRSELMANEVLRKMGATREQQEDIKKLAASSTFTDERGGVISHIANLMGNIANKNRVTQLLIKPFVPFTKVVANVTETALDAAPLYGFMRAHDIGVTGTINAAMKWAGKEGFKTSMLGEKNSQAYYEQMSRAWQGTIAFSVLLSMFAHGGDDDENYEDSYLQLTGGYDEETRKNKSGRAKITPKYTIRIGDFEISYLNIPALQVPLGLIGNYNDYMNLHRYDKEELDERMALAMKYSAAQTMTMVKDMTFVQGVQDLTSAIYEVATTEGSKVEKAAKSVFAQYFGFATRPLPQNNNMLLQIEKFFDPISYSRKEIEDITLYSLGVQHIWGKPSIDILGDAVKNYPAETTIPYTHWFDIYTADSNWRFMSRYNAIQGKLKNSPIKVYNPEKQEYEARTLEPNEFYEYTKLSGSLFKEKLQDYIKEVDAEKRVKEKVEYMGSTKNGVDYDLMKLQDEAQAQARARLFLANKVDSKIINELYRLESEKDSIQNIASKEMLNTSAEIDKVLEVTPEEFKLRKAIESSGQNVNAFVAARVNELKTKQEQSDFMYRLLEIRAISPETFRNVRETLGID